MNELTLPYVRIPKKVDRLLYILSQELKNNKSFNQLEAVGFDSTHSRSDFTAVVLDLIFKATCDELATIYFKLLDKHTKKMKDTRTNTLQKRAFKLYLDLVVERKKRISERIKKGA